MDFDVTVAVATYGEQHWVHLAQRAILSAHAQAPVLHIHADDAGDTLAVARNRALEQVDTEWVVFLDGDDELEAGYIDALASGTADLRAPAVRYISGQRAEMPHVPRVAGHAHACTADCLPHGNWLVIGTAVRTHTLREVGGWREFGWSEDWDAWLRCWKAGATVEAIPDAIYRAHVRPDSRNRAASRKERNRWHWEIHRANFPELYPDAA